MKFSVIIPLYNKELYVKRAIESVILQKYTDWECIVVNDGSTDKGPSIAQSYKDARIRLVDQDNSGVSVARNKGRECSSGEWIALLDADDYWLPSHLADLHEAITAHRECSVVATGWYVESHAGGRVVGGGLPVDGKITCHDYLTYEVTQEKSLLHTSSAAVKAELWTNVGGFNGKYRLAEDSEFWIRLSFHTKFAVNHNVSAVYYQDYSGNSTRGCWYIGDAPFIFLRQSVPDSMRFYYDRYLESFRINNLAMGNLLCGNRELVRKMTSESIKVNARKKTIVFMLLTFVPTKVFRILYYIYIKMLGRACVDKYINVINDKYENKYKH